MHALVRGATAAAVLTALSSLDRGPAEPPPTAIPPAVGGFDGRPTPCAPGTLPEGPVCVRIPRDDELAASRAAMPALAPSRGQAPPDRIPRRPERPADPAAYLYPAGGGAAEDGGTASAPRLLAGTDQPGIRIAVRPGEAVRAVALEHQVGPAEVVYTGDLFGPTVVTAHTVDEGGRRRTFLLYQAHLDHAAPGVAQGARLEGGAALGFARTELGAGLIDVYLEARELRDGAKLDAADAKRLTDTALAVPTDVRNVLPLR
jgi:hypothetical protein